MTRVALHPLAEEHVATLQAMRATPEVAAWWGPADDGFPWRDDPEATRFAIVAEGEVVGMIQYGEEPDEDFRHAWIDIFVDPRRHRRGIGTTALRQLVDMLLTERGHHRVTIDPAVDNRPAVRCYEKAGFRTVGVMRRSWRDPGGTWRDALLMEIVVDP